MKPLDAMAEPFQEVTLFEKPALFTNMRIDRGTVPEGYYAYDVRDEDSNGVACQVQPYVLVNHWGTVVLAEKLVMPEGYLCLNPTDLNYFGLKGCQNMKEFMEEYPHEKKEV